MAKTYFIGNLADLITDLGGPVKDAEQLWDDFIDILRKDNILNKDFELNLTLSSALIKSGFKKASEFFNKKLSISGLQICWYPLKRESSTTVKVKLIKNKIKDIDSIINDKFEASHYFLYLMPEIEDDEMICDVISETAAKIKASDSVLLEENKGNISISDLKTDAVFKIE